MHLKAMIPRDSILLHRDFLPNEYQYTGNRIPDTQAKFISLHLAHLVFLIAILPALAWAANQRGDLKIVLATTAGSNLHHDQKPLEI
jgi:hypothetical protein